MTQKKSEERRNQNKRKLSIQMVDIKHKTDTKGGKRETKKELLLQSLSRVDDQDCRRERKLGIVKTQKRRKTGGNKTKKERIQMGNVRHKADIRERNGRIEEDRNYQHKKRGMTWVDNKGKGNSDGRYKAEYRQKRGTRQT